MGRSRNNETSNVAPGRQHGQPMPIVFPVLICVLAFALRLVVMFAAHTYRVVHDDTQFFGFGWEMGRVAASLAEGHGFSSPLPLPTGPTAIVGPLYPLLLAFIFKVCGIYSTSSAIVIRIVQSAFASLTCLFIYLCGRNTVGDATGRLAAVAWALFPLNIFFTVDKVWETTLTAMLAVALFWFLLPALDSVSVRRWAGIGLLLGVAVLTSASIAVLVIPFGLLALWRFRARMIVPTVVSLLCFGAVLSPWLLRNRAEFGKAMLRDNFPLEFRIGNNMSSWGQKVEALHPSNTPAVNEHWQSVGELRFMAEESAANAEYVHAHTRRFALVTLNRIVNYWTGAWLRTIPGFPNLWTVIAATSLLTLIGFAGIAEMFRSGNPAASMYAGCLFFYPWTYYFTTTQPRFYHAMTPLLIVAGAFWLLQLRRRVTMQTQAPPPGSQIAEEAENATTVSF
jgi:4-amino-4-deoxy-L-arabinose transferase-like glycosyltransferase